MSRPGSEGWRPVLVRAVLSLALTFAAAEVPSHRAELRWRPVAVLPVGEPTPGLAGRSRSAGTMTRPT